MSLPARTWRSAARTETGKVRRHNEDAVLDRPALGLWAVADGMGGHRNGALASRLIVETLDALPAIDGLDARLEAVRRSLHALNRRLGQALTVTADCPEPVMGSTVVAVVCEGSQAACVWAGDSRCYLWRSGRLYQLSRDHSLRQQLVDAGELSEEQAAGHPNAHALTRAIGAHEVLELDILRFDVLPGDRLLLCSDGLYQSLATEALSAALGQPFPGLAVHCLFELALKGPARDNLSAVVIRP